MCALVALGLSFASAQVIATKPPQLNITSPAVGFTYDAGTSASVTLSGTAANVTNCAWTNSLGGSGSTTLALSGATLTWTAGTVALTVGSNILTVTCGNGAGGAVAQAMTVTRSSGGGGGLTCDETAASLTDTTVQSFLTAATTAGTSGDPYVYCLPAGSATWDQQVAWTAPAYTVLAGASASYSTEGGGDSTVITDAYDTTSSALLAITTSATGTFRLAGLTFQGTPSTDCQDAPDFVNACYKNNGIVVIGGSSTSVRLDHLHINLQTYHTQPSGGAGGTAIAVSNIRGVIDHSIFDMQGLGNIIRFYNPKSDGAGDAEWNTATGFGSSDWVFVEDNYFHANNQNATADHPLNDSQQAGKMIFRFNTIEEGGLQTHSTGASARGRGGRAMEVYGNDFVSVIADQIYAVVYLTNGGLLAWGNETDASSYEQNIRLIVNRKNNGTYNQNPTPSGWGYCGTAFNGTGSQWDGNTNASTGYPCLDQPGRGLGDLLSGDFSTVQNATLSCLVDNAADPDCWPRQALEPVREWLNTFTGNAYNNEASTVMTANQDYYAYTGSFTGATGIGSGTRAARPGACTTGVAYWSTDGGGNWNASTTNPRGVQKSGADGGLDVCTSTNTWTNDSYVPYTYPHPLNVN